MRYLKIKIILKKLVFLHGALAVMMIFILSQGRLFAQQVNEPEMVFVAGGSFTMGCTNEQGDDCTTDENPSHEVQLTGFAIAKYEVTQALWQQVMGNNPSRFKGDSLPVENVTWDDVQLFLQRLNAKTGKKYRLPTEAEWEYAARGGQQSRQNRFAGSTELAAVAWFSANAENSTHNVGTRQANELGLFDMSGNVWEWCEDLYGAYGSDRQTNPIGAKKGTARVLRGGCYASTERQCRVSGRKSLYQLGKDYMTGFRLAMDDDREARAAAAAQQAEQERIAAEKAAADAAKQAEQERIAAERQAQKEAHDRKVQHRRDSIRALPWNTFFTVNVAASPLPQISYGFTIGQVKVAGWYFSAMTNFHFKGAFKPFERSETYALTGKQKSSKLSFNAGLAVRPCKPLTLRIGTGFSCRALTVETTDGWRSYPKRTYYGVDAALGLMFHIKSFVISAEGVYTYTISRYKPQWSSALEGRIGVGFCLPNKR